LEHGKEVVLLIEYGSLSNSKHRYVTIDDLKKLVKEELEPKEKHVAFENNNEEKLRKIFKAEGDEKSFLQAFNETFEKKFSAIDVRTLNRPSLLIQWSESSELKSNQLLNYAEANEKFEKIAENLQKEFEYYKTRYSVLIPQETVSEPVIVVNMDRFDIGDGIYLNPHHQVRKKANLKPELWQALDDDVFKRLLEKEEKPVLMSNKHGDKKLFNEESKKDKMKYNIGDIVHAKIEFADSNKSANRFLVVLAKDEVIELYEGVNLTTKDKSFLESSVFIYKDELNKLSADSYAKVDTIYSFDESRIQYKKGELKPFDIDLLLAKRQQLQEKNKLIVKHLNKTHAKEEFPSKGESSFFYKKERRKFKKRDEFER